MIDLIELVGVQRRATQHAEQQRADHTETDAQADPHVPLGLVADRRIAVMNRKIAIETGGRQRGGPR